MNRNNRCAAIAVLLLVSGEIQAQVAPICPSADEVVIEHHVPGPPRPYLDDSEIVVAIRRFVPDGAWDFKLENLAISSTVISADAPGSYVAFVTNPTDYAVIGPFAAGDYSLVIRPIATNVTPNVYCPTLTFPLTVVPRYTEVPVPATNATVAAILAGLASLAGMWRLRRRTGATR